MKLEYIRFFVINLKSNSKINTRLKFFFMWFYYHLSIYIFIYLFIIILCVWINWFTKYHYPSFYSFNIELFFISFFHNNDEIIWLTEVLSRVQIYELLCVTAMQKRRWRWRKDGMDRRKGGTDGRIDGRSEWRTGRTEGQTEGWNWRKDRWLGWQKNEMEERTNGRMG